MVLYFTKLLLEGKNDLKKIWLAAHWQQKLKRNQIVQIDIVSSVRDIMSQEIILDLRLSGHLLVGIVRIFSKKTQYLLCECNNIFNRVRIFRGEVVTELPPNKMEARFEDITLPETFTFGKADEDALFLLNQSQVEEITLKETVGNARLLSDDFDEMVLEEENNGDMFEDDLYISLFNSLEEPPPANRKVSEQSVLNCEDEQNVPNDIEMEYCNGGGFPPGSSTDSSRHQAPRHISMSQGLIFVEDSPKERDGHELINLEPLSDNLLNTLRRKRKRKLIVDATKTLSKERMRKQYLDTSDIVTPLDLAPPSKRLMTLKEVGEAKKIFLHPGMDVGNAKILRLFTRNLKTRKCENVEESSWEEDSNNSFPSIEIPRQDALLNENSSADELLDGNEFHIENFAEGMEGNEIELDIESSNPTAHQHRENKEINFSNEIQFDISASENPTENVHIVFQDKIVSLLKSLKVCFENQNRIRFSELLRKDKRRLVARKFFSLLLLKKFGIVDLHQSDCFNEIVIMQGENFGSACDELCKN